MSAMPAERRIEHLPEIVAALPSEDRERFDSIYRVTRVHAALTVPGSMTESLGRRFGDLGLVSGQTVVTATNRYTLEATSFNGLRALRPMSHATGSSTEPDVDDPFADPETQTPDNVIGRVRGRRSVTAANVAASDAWHGVIIFNEPDPLAFDAEDVVDYLSTGLEWARRAHVYDGRAVHPFLFWNANPRAGASLTHGHAQVIVRSDAPMARTEVQRSAAARYRSERHGSNYFDDVMDAHESVGLGSTLGTSRVAAHLTPIKERELLIIGTGLDEDFFRSVGRALVSFRDAMSVTSFNLAVFGPPLDEAERAGWEGFPAVARMVDRGRNDARSSDFAGMELYGQSVVSADPFDVARTLIMAL